MSVSIAIGIERSNLPVTRMPDHQEMETILIDEKATHKILLNKFSFSEFEKFLKTNFSVCEFSHFIDSVSGMKDEEMDEKKNNTENAGPI